MNVLKYFIGHLEIIFKYLILLIYILTFTSTLNNIPFLQL